MSDSLLIVVQSVGNRLSEVCFISNLVEVPAPKRGLVYLQSPHRASVLQYGVIDSLCTFPFDSICSPPCVTYAPHLGVSFIGLLQENTSPAHSLRIPLFQSRFS